ncbi:MAG: hypothetical protein JWM10_161 [Myxococcaceae bacterium]|nr:hypothetical protein [Myxococcaceae bacterium]
MSNRTRLSTVLLFTGALAGVAACGQSEPTTAFPRASASSGGYVTPTTASVTPRSNDPMNSPYGANGNAVGSTTYVAPGNGTAGFDNTLTGNGVNQGGRGMGGYSTTTSTEPVNPGSSAPVVAPNAGAIDSDPTGTNATSTGISGNITTGRNTGTSTTTTGTNSRPRSTTGTGTPR